MRVAVLSDIHANLPALDAVLAEIAGLRRPVDLFVLLGDHVGYYHQPAEVVARLRGLPHLAIRGNHDRMALAARDSGAGRDEYIARYGHGLETALDRLSAEDWQWLKGLPERRTAELGSFAIDLCHGAPFDPDAYIYPDAAPELLQRVAEASEADAVWMGHTHHPFLRPGAPWLLNPGSVGQPRDLGLASWCLFDAETGSVGFRRTDYDASAVIAEVGARDPEHARNGAVLRRGRVA